MPGGRRNGPCEARPPGTWRTLHQQRFPQAARQVDLRRDLATHEIPLRAKPFGRGIDRPEHGRILAAVCNRSGNGV